LVYAGIWEHISLVVRASQFFVFFLQQQQRYADFAARLHYARPALSDFNKRPHTVRHLVYISRNTAVSRVPWQRAVRLRGIKRQRRNVDNYGSGAVHGVAL
jgi:hypothetical protein